MKNVQQRLTKKPKIVPQPAPDSQDSSRIVIKDTASVNNLVNVRKSNPASILNLPSEKEVIQCKHLCDTLIFEVYESLGGSRICKC